MLDAWAGSVSISSRPSTSGLAQSEEEDVGIADDHASQGKHESRLLDYMDVFDGTCRALQALNVEATKAQGEVAALRAAGSDGHDKQKKTRHEQIHTNARCDLRVLKCFNTKGHIQMRMKSSSASDHCEPSGSSTGKRVRLDTRVHSVSSVHSQSSHDSTRRVSELQHAALRKVVDLWEASLADGDDDARISAHGSNHQEASSLWRRLNQLGPREVPTTNSDDASAAEECGSSAALKENSAMTMMMGKGTSTKPATKRTLSATATTTTANKPEEGSSQNHTKPSDERDRDDDAGDRFSVLLLSRSSQAVFQTGGGMGPGAGWDVVGERAHSALLWKCLTADRRQVRVGGMECARHIAELCAASSPSSGRLRDTTTTTTTTTGCSKGRKGGGAFGGGTKHPSSQARSPWETQSMLWQKRTQRMREFHMFKRRPLHFPQDFPDAPASQAWWKTWSRRQATDMARQPPSKRLRGVQSWTPPQWHVLFSSPDCSATERCTTSSSEGSLVPHDSESSDLKTAAKTHTSTAGEKSDCFGVTVVRNAMYAQAFLVDEDVDSSASHTDIQEDGEESSVENELQIDGKRSSPFLYVKKGLRSPAYSATQSAGSSARLETKFPTLVSVTVVMARRGFPHHGSPIFLPTANDYHDWRAGRRFWRLQR
jgi:hypothetical protein